MIWFASSFCFLFFYSENKISEQTNFCKYYVLFHIYFWVFFYFLFYLYWKEDKINIIMHILLLFSSQEPYCSTTTSYNRNIQGLDLPSPILTIILYRLLFVFHVNKMWVIVLYRVLWGPIVYGPGPLAHGEPAGPSWKKLWPKLKSIRPRMAQICSRGRFSPRQA